MPVTHPQLQQILHELDEASSRARQLAERNADRTFSTRPSATAWSAAEAMAHLALTARGMLAPIDGALEAERAIERVRPAGDSGLAP